MEARIPPESQSVPAASTTHASPPRYRVVHITTVHPWYDPRIHDKMCKSLHVRGHSVHLIACELPSPDHSVIDGVTYHWLPPKKAGLLNRLRATWRAFTRARKIHADIFHFHDPELMPVAGLLRLTGRRVVFDVHEDLPAQTLNRQNLSPALKRLLSRLASVYELFVGHPCSTSVVTVSAPLVQRFPGRKTFLVRNFPEIKGWADRPAAPWNERENVVVYAGTTALSRGMTTLAQLADALSASGTKVRIVGKIAPDLQDSLKNERGWNRIETTGWLGRERVWAELNRAKAGIHVALPTAQRSTSYPTKIFEYMAAGLPVIFGNSPAARHFVENHNCGIIVDPLNLEEIAAAANWLIDHPQKAEEMGARGRAAVLQEHNWEHEMSALLRSYDYAMKREGASR